MTTSLNAVTGMWHPVPASFGDEPTKRCAKCGHTHPLADFHRDRTAKDGLYSRCRFCKQNFRSTRPHNRPSAPPPAPNLPGTTRICAGCGQPFQVGRSLPGRQICATCQDRLKLSADETVAAGPSKNVLAGLPVSDAQAVYDLALKTLLSRHRQEFIDICRTEAERFLDRSNS